MVSGVAAVSSGYVGVRERAVDLVAGLLVTVAVVLSSVSSVSSVVEEVRLVVFFGA